MTRRGSILRLPGRQSHCAEVVFAVPLPSIGSLPMVVASYYRWRMHETEAFSELSRKMAASPEYANQTLRERFYNAVVAVKVSQRGRPRRGLVNRLSVMEAGLMPREDASA